MHIFLLDRLVQAIVFYHKRQHTIRTLNALNDHMLKDIGIERQNILSATDRLIELEKDKLAQARQSETRRMANQNRAPSRCVEPV